MAGIFLALFGVWFIGAGYHGNGTDALKFLSQQTKFIPWFIAILILWALYQVKTIRPAIKPLVILALITLIVKNFSKIQSQYKLITGAK